MKKLGKIIAIVLAIATVGALLCVSLVACGKKSEKVEVKDIELTSESYAFVLQKGDTATKNTVDSLLADLKGEGYVCEGKTYTLDGIINSFFNGNATFEYTNPESKTGCLVVATHAYFPPFEFYNGNKLTGVDMQIAYLLAKKMNKTLYILDEPFSTIFTSVQNGEALLGMAGITVTEKRKETYDFSNEYYTSAQVIVVKENDTTFDNCQTAADVEAILAQQDKNFVVGTQNATTGYMYTFGDEDFGYDGFKNLTTKGYTVAALAIKDLSAGKVNVVIVDKQPAIMISKSING